MVDGDNLRVAQLVSGQADLFDVGQVGAFGHGALPLLGVVKVAARPVVAQRLRANQIALEAADKLHVAPRRIDVCAALGNDQHIAPRHRLLLARAAGAWGKAVLPKWSQPSVLRMRSLPDQVPATMLATRPS